MSPTPPDTLRWIAAEILPFEGDVRGALAKTRLARAEIDDLIQDAYCRLAGVVDVTSILNPRAYFFTVVRNLVHERARRSSAIPLDHAAELEPNAAWDETPSAERQVIAAQELARVRDALSRLPDRCREVVRLRKLEGLSQKEIARRLQITENVVEKQLARGLKLLLDDLSVDERQGATVVVPMPSRKRLLR